MYIPAFCNWPNNLEMYVYILCFFHNSRYPTSIGSLAFSADGALLAIASTYMYEQGEIDNKPEDAIFIRKVSDQETKPK